MPTLLDLKKQAAAILTKDIADFTVNGQDLWLAAANQAVQIAELGHDFEFNRKLVTVTVNGITGGSLAAAIDADLNVVDVKTVIDVGLVSGTGNLIPARWTTVAENFEGQRQSNRRASPMFLTDAEAEYGTAGISAFTFSGDRIYRWPRTSETDSTNYALNLEVYAFSAPWISTDLSANIIIATGNPTPDYSGTFTLAGTYASDGSDFRRFWVNGTTAILFYDGITWRIQDFSEGFTSSANYYSIPATSDDDPAGAHGAHGTFSGSQIITVSGGTSDIWTTHGAQYLLWQTVVHLNKLFRVFVPRQEGNLPPPTDLADSGLQTLIDWDSMKYEQFRRHNR